MAAGTLLPTFFVVGAPRAATTSLHHYLAAHPEIAMTTEKEPMCFEPSDWRDRIGAYRTLFAEDAAVRGESSTAYAAYPWAPEVPDRVLELVPDARIVYMVRDPIERTLSHYARNVRDRMPVRPFAELVRDLEDPLNMPVWCSRYATQLERWQERFGVERVLVLDRDELRRDRRTILRRVLAFLGVDPEFTSEAWGVEHNGTAHVQPPRPTRRERLRLERFLAPEAERLREMTGLELRHWRV